MTTPPQALVRRPFCLMDFETASQEDLKEGGAWRYSECPTTEVICCVYSNSGAEPWGWRPSKYRGDALFELAADPTCTFVRHGDFEVAIWRNIMVPEFGFPDIPDERWHDTMAAAAVRALPLSLEDLCKVLRLPFQKDMEGSRITRNLSKFRKDGSLDRSAATISRVVEYCEQDVHAELALHHRLGYLPDDERPAWLLNQRMNARGLRIDLDYVAKAQEVVDKASVPLLARFREITGLKPTQIQKVRKWCAANGTTLPSLDAETVATALGGMADGSELDIDVVEDFQPPEMSEAVREALSIRQLIGSSSIKKLGRMAACVCADGRARGLSQYHGTGPGRSTGRLFQPYNFPRGTLKLGDEAPPPEMVVDAIMTGDPEYVQMVLGPPIQSVVSGLRHAIVPNRGNVFLSGDYSGIQARVVLALSGQHDKTAIMAAGKDVYCDMAQQIYKRPIDKKKDPAERHVGKNSVLGLGFQMGWKKFKLKYGKEHTDEFCENVVRVYREEWAPCVPKLWHALGDAALRAVRTERPSEAYGIEYRLEDGWLSARLPAGRKLWYWNPRLVKRAMPWDDTDIRLAFTYQAQKNGQWKEITAFGGQLCENVVMGIECDIHRHGMMNCEKAGFPVVLEIYDEVVAEVPEGKADLKAFHQCMLDQPDWVRQLRIPVAVEGWVDVRYKK